MPKASRRVFTSGSVSDRLISVCSLLTIDLGMPRGPMKPYQLSTANPSTPRFRDCRNIREHFHPLRRGHCNSAYLSRPD